MSIKTIPCGGFKYDDSTVEFVDGVMKSRQRVKYSGTLKSAEELSIENSDALMEEMRNKTVLPNQIIVVRAEETIIEGEQFLASAFEIVIPTAIGYHVASHRGEKSEHYFIEVWGQTFEYDEVTGDWSVAT